jgi:uncharacterized membrane protein
MKTLLAIILNILGIAICFLTKYSGRREQDKTFSLSFWLKDNWPELAITVLFDAAMVLLVMTGDIELNVTQFIPEWVANVGALTISFLLGLGVAAAIYEVFKKKIIYSKEKD